MRRLTLDSNIYISALKFGGEPLRLLNMAGEGEIEIAISEPIIREVIRVLGEKFAWPAERLERTEASLRKLCRVITPIQRLDAVKNDPDDNCILECAVAAGSEAIVTGDKKHLLPIRNYQGIRIIKVSDFLEREIER